MPRLLLTIALLLAGVYSLEANPTGGSVVGRFGFASISGQGSSTVTINQSSNTAIIDWQTFSIGAGELTKFIQPSSSSATLNRVLGGQTSLINGTLSANGQIYLINGNGIIVGAGGVISTAGFTAARATSPTAIFPRATSTSLAATTPACRTWARSPRWRQRGPHRQDGRQ